MLPIDEWTTAYFKRRLKRLDQVQAIVDEDQADWRKRVPNQNNILNESLNSVIHEARRQTINRLYDLGQIEVKP